MICSQCGADVAEGKKFCMKCGAKVESSPSGADAAAQDKIWHIHTGGKNSGPFSSGTIKQLLSQNSINTTTPLWRAGMAGWAPLGSISEFASSAQTPGAQMPGAQMPAAGIQNYGPAGSAGALSNEELKKKDAEARARIKQLMEEDKQRKKGAKGGGPILNANTSNAKPLLGGDSAAVPVTENILFILAITFCCCWPIGLYYLWKSETISQNTKIIITVIVAVMAIVGIIGRIMLFSHLRSMLPGSTMPTIPAIKPIAVNCSTSRGKYKSVTRLMTQSSGP